MDRKAVVQLVATLERFEEHPDEWFDLLSKPPPTHKQGACLCMLYAELADAFSYMPGRMEALAPILSLARKLAKYWRDDTSRLYREPEWARLVAMRGPVEGVSIHTCRACLRSRVSFAMNGFSSEMVAACGVCGSVLVQSAYDLRPFPPCDCGGAYALFIDACPPCERVGDVVQGQSSYKYFADHSWKRRSA